MSPATPRKPVIVQSAGQTFEIHLGRPGRPLVYEVTNPHTNPELSDPARRPVRKLRPNDPRLPQIARDYQVQFNKRKATAERLQARSDSRSRWRLLGARLGRPFARVWAWLSRLWR